MNYGNIKECDIADGPGVRVSLFVSGCRHHCKGCFNEETWNFNYGQPYTEETEAEILNSLDSNFIQGFTLLGGEPFEPENQVELVKLLKKVRETYPFLHEVLTIVVGLEFVRMLIDTTPANILEVLAVAITRHVILSHDDPISNLLSVACIAGLFAIRRFLFRRNELKEEMVDRE